MKGLTFFQEWYGRAVQAVRADPKKASALAVLSLVMVGLWARYVVWHGGPSPAAGSLTPAPAAVTADNAAGHAPANPAQLVQQWTRGHIEPLSRNLFAVNYDDFPDDGTVTRTTPSSDNDGFWGDLQKSMDARADEKKRRRQVIDHLRGQAAQLHVQSLVMGETPKALVNGQLVGAGDMLTLPDAQFRVVRIGPEGVVVQSQGVRLELTMD